MAAESVRHPRAIPEKIDIINLEELLETLDILTATDVLSEESLFTVRYSLSTDDAPADTVWIVEETYELRWNGKDDERDFKMILLVPEVYTNALRHLFYFYHAWVGVLLYADWGVWIDAMEPDIELVSEVWRLKIHAAEKYRFFQNFLVAMIAEGQKAPRGSVHPCPVVPVTARIKTLDSWLWKQWLQVTYKEAWERREGVLDPLGLGMCSHLSSGPSRRQREAFCF